MRTSCRSWRTRRPTSYDLAVPAGRPRTDGRIPPVRSWTGASRRIEVAHGPARTSGRRGDMGPRSRNKGMVALAIGLTVLLAACRADVTDLINSPRDGQMQDFGGTTTVSGVIPSEYPDGGTLKVQGVDTPYAPLASDPNRSWTATIPLDA